MSSRHLTEYNTLRDNGMLYTRTAPGLGEGPGPPTKRGPPSCPYVLPYMRHVRATSFFIKKSLFIAREDGSVSLKYYLILWRNKHFFVSWKSARYLNLWMPSHVERI